MRSPRAIPWRISADGLRRPRSIWLRYGFEMPASSLSLRSDSRALRRWSRMKSPRSCSRVSSESSDSVSHPAVPATRRSAITRSIASITTCICARRSESSRSKLRSAVERRRRARRAAEPGSFASVVSTTSCSRWSGHCELDRGRIGRGRAARRRRSSSGRTPRSGSGAGRRRDRRPSRRARAAPARPRGSPCAPARAAGSTRARARPARTLRASRAARRAIGVELGRVARARAGAGRVPWQSLPGNGARSGYRGTGRP